MTVLADFDLYNRSRQATKILAADGYGYDDVLVKLAALRLPVDRAWVRWWVMIGKPMEDEENKKAAALETAWGEE